MTNSDEIKITVIIYRIFRIGVRVLPRGEHQLTSETHFTRAHIRAKGSLGPLSELSQSKNPSRINQNIDTDHVEAASFSGGFATTSFLLENRTKNTGTNNREKTVAAIIPPTTAFPTA